jgi:hypothetical protein
MILGKPHAASDLFSPFLGPTLGFKDNAYNTLQPRTEKDAARFGEKPFLIYTPRCGDCLLKLVLNRRRAGLGSLLPHPIKEPQQREIVVKALMRYQYTIVQPDASFHMITDAEQVEHVLIKPYVYNNKKVGQLCLNDDAKTHDPNELEALRNAMGRLFEGLLPKKSSFEK